MQNRTKDVAVPAKLKQFIIVNDTQDSNYKRIENIIDKIAICCILIDRGHIHNNTNSFNNKL
ncbi:MAG: hypothetical protein DRP54_03655 [Spirochaetes bacterium]|nr:MAG: hypothetical protein DRP54_03655 [Spirochaetota bacterium]